MKERESGSSLVDNRLIVEAHETFQELQVNTKMLARNNDLMTKSVIEGLLSLRIFINDSGHGDVGDDSLSTLDGIEIDVGDASGDLV